MANYWLVGASWGGIEHQDQKFIDECYWMLGWKEDQQPEQYQKAQQMKKGDRIAIKRMKGKGQSQIKILHIGIICGVVLDTNKVICTVDWLVKDVDRDVDAKGAFASIHGPYQHDATNRDTWIEQIFCI